MKNNKLPKLKVSKPLKKEFKQFLEYHPAKRVNRNLRRAFVSYIQHTLDGVPLDMDDIIWDISSLMELLDVAEDETKDWPEF
ncbi:MAG: hypothetical protein J7623_19210 [Chitinophaga sp.]|uniref:hypothetical protein n=1 Tax=Chitinophaga sp. TaxID=1869181 RepID=UPI001B2F4EA9|nr:hypothetical protein [Chitinophaga sp.]MBO9730778.1 hypothetical protein [Chitinophaga sp.]